jgi:hypothetical protein
MADLGTIGKSHYGGTLATTQAISTATAQTGGGLPPPPGPLAAHSLILVSPTGGARG